MAPLHSQEQQDGWRLHSGSVLNQLFVSHRWLRQSCTGVPYSSPQPWVSPECCLSAAKCCSLRDHQDLWCRWDLCWLPLSCFCRLLTFGPQPWREQSCCCQDSPSAWATQVCPGAGLDTWGWIRFEGIALPCSPQLIRCGGERQHCLNCAMYQQTWDSAVKGGCATFLNEKQCKCCVAKLGFPSKCANTL